VTNSVLEFLQPVRALKKPETTTMRTPKIATLAVLLATLHVVTAAEFRDGDNRFSVNAALGYNIKLSSRNLQGPPPNPGPATGAQENRFYDNGYVRLDVSENQGGSTTWWKSDTVQSGQPGGAVMLSSTRSPAQGETFLSQDDPQVGVDLGYARRLFRCGEADKPWLIVGVEAGFAWLDLVIQDTPCVTGNAVTTDTFHLAPGNVVLGSSYEGNFLGDPPGPLLEAEPTGRDFTPGIVTLANRLDGNLFAFKLGPTFELPLGKSVLVGVSGGWVLTGVLADYDCHETTMIGTEAPSATSGSGKFDSWQGGLYVKGNVAVELGRQWQAQAGVQWQDTGNVTGQAGKYQTRLDLGQVLLISLGFGFSF
jgi:hypothetical protein